MMMVPNGEWAERGGRKTSERPFVTLDDNGRTMVENHSKKSYSTLRAKRATFTF